MAFREYVLVELEKYAQIFSRLSTDLGKYSKFAATERDTIPTVANCGEPAAGGNSHSILNSNTLASTHSRNGQELRAPGDPLQEWPKKFVALHPTLLPT